jgi:microcystin-dependent protein
MSEPFIGEIRAFPFNFAPKGWAKCDGTLLPISQNTALFSLLGTAYGGDGQSTFALPNLRGAAPLGQGQGPGLSQRVLGEVGGSETVTLLTAQVPSHTHTVAVASSDAIAVAQSNPAANTVFGESQARARSAGYVSDLSAASVELSPSMVGPAGGSAPHNNMPPYLTLNFCIALQGVYPART